MTSTTTPWFRFGGANIKGTPAMKASAVAHDLRVLSKEVDVAVLQEFKWRWYWVTLHAILKGLWGTAPKWRDAVPHPIKGAQAVIWRRKMFKRLDEKAMLLHDGRGGISDDRWLRAARLQVKGTLLSFWALTTHYVVGGDMAGDGPERKDMMYREDIPNLDKMLTALLRSGWPVILELDANIHRTSAAYDEFMAVIRKHKGQVIGAVGVEYLVVFQGTKAGLDVRNAGIIPTSRLKTDHEVRTVEARVRTLR